MKILRVNYIELAHVNLFWKVRVTNNYARLPKKKKINKKSDSKIFRIGNHKPPDEIFVL